jgi:hypothetical protein
MTTAKEGRVAVAVVVWRQGKEEEEEEARRAST